MPCLKKSIRKLSIDRLNKEFYFAQDNFDVEQKFGEALINIKNTDTLKKLWTPLPLTVYRTQPTP